jgi:hypothetical protein
LGPRHCWCALRRCHCSVLQTLGSGAPRDSLQATPTPSDGSGLLQGFSRLDRLTRCSSSDGQFSLVRLNFGTRSRPCVSKSSAG